MVRGGRGPRPPFLPSPPCLISMRRSDSHLRLMRLWNGYVSAALVPVCHDEIQRREAQRLNEFETRRCLAMDAHHREHFGGTRRPVSPPGSWPGHDLAVIPDRSTDTTFAHFTGSTPVQDCPAH